MDRYLTDMLYINPVDKNLVQVGNKRRLNVFLSEPFQDFHAGFITDVGNGHADLIDTILFYQCSYVIPHLKILKPKQFTSHPTPRSILPAPRSWQPILINFPLIKVCFFISIQN